MKTRVSALSNLFLMLSFSLFLESCNKEDFYEKEYLDNPYQTAPTETDVPGDTGPGPGVGDQGGTSGTTGVTGGQAGTPSTGTDGSTVGGSTGGTTGGGVDGSTTSGQTGGIGADGSAAGGTSAGGSAGGVTTGGADGSAAGGASAGGSAGGVTTGGADGSAAGGASAGGSAGGVTTGGADGSAAGGSSTGGGNPAPTIETETFRQVSSTAKKLDIVWIIDNSGSMADEQSALGTNFSAFINEFITKDVDFKMAITTTDVSSADRKGRMVTDSNTRLTSAQAQSNELRFKDDFRRMVRVGTSGSGNEKGLEAAEGFMQKHATSFLRPDAYLAVVVVSDEEDQSPRAVTFYTDYLKSFKAQAGLVKVYTIADVNRTNSGNGITTGADRYMEASTQTAGSVADIRADFYRTLSEMGDSIINLLDSFALAHDPAAGTLRVFVNGAETTQFDLDVASRSIRFLPGNLPPVGAEITVQYVKQ